MEPISKSATAEKIRETESISREIKVYPWMATYMSRLWKDMKKNISLTMEQEIIHKTNSVSIVSGTAVQHHNAQ